MHPRARTTSRGSGGLSRREFLAGTGALSTAFLLPSLPRGARAAGTDPVLVALYLRGAADGLNLVVPAGDPDYYTLRPDIQVPAGSELPLDTFYGLNPALADLLPIYSAGELAVVHAAGSPDSTRSHFDAQDYMERGAPSNPNVDDGWLNRYLASAGLPDPWAGISVSAAQVLALAGSAPSLAMPSVDDFVLGGSPDRRAALQSMYQGSFPAALAQAADDAFLALDVIGTVPPGDPTLYPAGPYGAALADAAALIRADIGVRVVAVDIGGWDHHSGEVAALDGVGSQLASGLAALRADLGTDWDRTCVVAMTEFGRTAAQNGSQGTDHGHGSVMLTLGGGVSGGQVLTKNDVWPGLAPGNLFEGRDLAITSDFRDVFAEVLHLHMGASLSSLASVLPGHTVSTANFPGVFA